MDFSSCDRSCQLTSWRLLSAPASDRGPGWAAMATRGSRDRTGDQKAETQTHGGLKTSDAKLV